MPLGSMHCIDSNALLARWEPHLSSAVRARTAINAQALKDSNALLSVLHAFTRTFCCVFIFPDATLLSVSGMDGCVRGLLATLL